MIPLPGSEPGGRLVDPTSLLGADRPGEITDHAPGPVDNEEVVHVGLAHGRVVSVVVDQHLTVHGTGDFELHITGPARDVSGPPDQSPRPGLRRGAVVWQGFGAGTKQLEATVTLMPDLEEPRLPLRVTRDGGVVRITNTTSRPVAMTDGAADQAALEGLLTAVRAELAAGRAPVPGTRNVPRMLPATSTVRSVSREVMVPLHVVGTVAREAIDVVLPSAAHPDGVWQASAADDPVVKLRAEVALPDAAVLTGQAGLADAEVTLAQVARHWEYERYLGVHLDGSSTASFEYAPAASIAPPRPAAAPERRRPLVVILTLFAGLAVGAGAVFLWSRS